VSRQARDRSRLSRLRAIPWAGTLRVVVAFGKRVTALSAKDRRRLAALVRQSRGRPGNLSDRERRELMGIVAELDLLGVARELSGLTGQGRRRRRR
jgi:hypothetical protein